jgi:antitoxin ParD1/3/4
MGHGALVGGQEWNIPWSQNPILTPTPSWNLGQPGTRGGIVVVFIATEVHLMPTVEKLSIALPTEMAALVRSAVDLGEYASNSEVIRDALREWTYKRKLREQGLQNLRKQWQEAVADDSEGLDPGPIFDRLESKYDGLAKAKGR